jgi:hypothetical protein
VFIRGFQLFVPPGNNRSAEADPTRCGHAGSEMFDALPPAQHRSAEYGRPVAPDDVRSGGEQCEPVELVRPIHSHVAGIDQGGHSCSHRITQHFFAILSRERETAFALNAYPTAWNATGRRAQGTGWHTQ